MSPYPYEWENLPLLTVQKNNKDFVLEENKDLVLKEMVQSNFSYELLLVM